MKCKGNLSTLSNCGYTRTKQGVSGSTYIFVHMSKMFVTWLLYRLIHKSLRDFRPLHYSSRDGHAEGEHVNRGRDTSIFCPTLQALDMSTLGDAADVNPVIKFLLHMCNVCGRNLITEYCFVGTFAELRKATISFLLSVRVEQVGSHRTDFHEI